MLLTAGAAVMELVRGIAAKTPLVPPLLQIDLADCAESARTLDGELEKFNSLVVSNTTSAGDLTLSVRSMECRASLSGVCGWPGTSFARLFLNSAI
jgi:hypothetical protein